MEIYKKIPQTPRWKLERQAARGLAILDRHVGEDPAIDSFVETFKPVALEYLAAQHKLYSRTPGNAIEMAESHEAIRQLERKIRVWLGPLERDIVGFSSGDYTQHLDVPEDIINAAEGLVHYVTELEATGRAPAYANDVVETLTAAVEHAKTQLHEARGDLANVQELRSHARELAVQLHKELVAFRRVLRNLLGDSHRDYQLLRTSQVSHGDDEDEILEALESDEPTAEGVPAAASAEPAALTPSEEVAAE